MNKFILNREHAQLNKMCLRSSKDNVKTSQNYSAYLSAGTGVQSKKSVQTAILTITLSLYFNC